MMLAWFSASLTIVAPSGARIGMTPVLAVNPDWKVRTASVCLNVGQPRLELLVEAHRAGDRPHRPRSRAEPLDGVERRLPQLRVGVEAEVVVARERDDLAAVDDAAALLLALDHAQAPVEALRLQLVDLGVQEGEGVARARRGIGHGLSIGPGDHGMSTTLPAWRDGDAARTPAPTRQRSRRWVMIGETSSDPGPQQRLRPLPRVVDAAPVDAVQPQALHDHALGEVDRSAAPPKIPSRLIRPPRVTDPQRLSRAPARRRSSRARPPRRRHRWRRGSAPRWTDRHASSARSAPIVRASSRRNGSVSVATTSAAPAALAIPTAHRPIGPQPVTRTVLPLDRLDEGGVDGVAHRLLERDDRGVEPVRLDRVRLRDDDALGEARHRCGRRSRAGCGTGACRRAGIGRRSSRRGATLDADEVALLHAGDAAAGADHRAGQLVAEDPRWLEVLGRPLVPGEQVEVRPADARRLDAEEDLAWPRRRRRAARRAPRRDPAAPWPAPASCRRRWPRSPGGCGDRADPRSLGVVTDRAAARRRPGSRSRRCPRSRSA